MTAAEHRELISSLSQAAIDHIHEEYREWRGESEHAAAVRDTNHVLELQSRKP
jgi:hypothetical protein